MLVSEHKITYAFEACIKFWGFHDGLLSHEIESLG